MIDINKAKIIILAGIILNFSFALCFGQSKGINQKQPISIGETIYYDSAFYNQNRFAWLEYMQYKYLGAEKNSLKISVEYQDTLSSQEIKKDELILPLNEKKQALLKVQTRGYLAGAELVITVVDDFYRIKVEPLRIKGETIQQVVSQTQKDIVNIGDVVKSLKGKSIQEVDVLLGSPLSHIKSQSSEVIQAKYKVGDNILTVVYDKGLVKDWYY